MEDVRDFNRKTISEARSMTVRELIDALEELVAEEPELEGAEARLLTQPSYPFQHSLARVVGDREIAEAVAEADVDFGDGQRAVYLLEGSQVAYGHRAAWG